MKVLHVITGLSDGGAEAVLYRLISHDIADTHHVISLTSDGKYGARLRAVGAVVTALSMPNGRITLGGLHRLWCVVRNDSPDVMQTWMYHADLLGGIIGYLAGVPVIWGLRNTKLEAGKSSKLTIWTARICAWLSRWIPSRIIVCAEAAFKVHAELGYEVKSMIVIPNGYDLTRLSLNKIDLERFRSEWRGGDIPLIGMVARFDPYKDHTNLIDALAYLHARGVEFRAVLVGAGVDTGNKKLVSQIVAKGLAQHVRLLGPRNDIPAVMSALNIHVLSSSAEAFPNVLAEAMACGTPCVATDVGDARFIIGDTGWVVPPSNGILLANALEVALAELLNREAWLDRQSRCCQRIREKYTLEKMTARYRDVWAEALILGSSRRIDT